MWRNALIATVSILFAFVFWVGANVDFLIPYRNYILNEYGHRILIYLGLLSVNLFGLFFWLTRKLLLKDTGRKLVHLERQVRSGEVATDLGQLMAAEEQ